MPLATRSLGRFLLPVVMGLSPLAASAASEVTILRDEWGMPQVYADDVYGLYAGFGYAVAEDRLFQMEMARRSVLGTVAEVLGSEHVAYDTKTRADYDHAAIRAQIEALPAEERDILRGYAAGYNKRLAEVMADRARLMPKEFADFGFEPVRVDGVRRGDDLRRHHGRGGSRTSRTSSTTPSSSTPSWARWARRRRRRSSTRCSGSRTRWRRPRCPRASSTSRRRRRRPVDVTRFAGLADLPVQGGEDDRPRASNLWILGPEKTTDGSTILVNGPQFGNFNPAYVFSIGLHGAGYDITGNTPFAVPVVLFGTNGQIAWGATAGPLDVNDYVELELNPENPHQYRQGDGWADMRLRQETIKVKGAEDVTAEVWECDYGVVQVFDAEHDRAFAFHRTWAGYEIPTLMAWIRSTRAQNYDEWLDAAEDVATTINWYYADRDGNIGYVSPGYLPVSQAVAGPAAARQGRRQHGLAGHAPLRRRAEDLNPEQGWIANWNNRSGKGVVSTVEGSPWGAADRVVEIMARIEAKDRLTPEEVWGILPATSFVDVNARYFVPRILAAGNALPIDDPRQPMLAALRDWDTRQIRGEDGRATAPAVAIFRTWMDVMVADVLLDDSPAIPAKVMQTRIALPSALLNNALLGEHAGVPQTYDFLDGADPVEVILAALEKTRVALAEEYGSDDVAAWRLPLDQHVFATENYLGIPQASADEEARHRHGDEPRHGERHDPLRRRQGQLLRRHPAGAERLRRAGRREVAALRGPARALRGVRVPGAGLLPRRRGESGGEPDRVHRGVSRAGPRVTGAPLLSGGGQHLRRRAGHALEPLAELGQGLRLELADALLGEAELLAEALERARLVAELALDDDQPLARAERAERLGEPAADPGEVGVARDGLGGLRGLVLERLQPLAAFLARLLGVEREVRPGEARVHHLHVAQRHADLGPRSSRAGGGRRAPRRRRRPRARAGRAPGGG